MKVLLISPLDPKQPTDLKLLMGGESTYTKMLLRHPPKITQFIHLQDAIKKNEATLHPLTDFLLLLQKCRLLPLGPRAYVLIVNKKFDLLYAHAHPVAILGTNVPLVFSDSSSNTIFLRHYLKVSPTTLRIQMFLKKIVYRFFSIVDGEVNPTDQEKFFVFSKWASRIKSNLCIPVQVIYPGLPISKRVLRKPRAKIKLLFVGVWFERKGGIILLDVYKELKLLHPELSLTILGKVPDIINTDQYQDVTHKNFVSYKELLNTYKTHDILVHIPPEIEGYGMTVPEAMSYGICCVVSRICALPEFVEDGKTGLIILPGSKAALYAALRKLIENKHLIRQYGDAAREKFVKEFSLGVFHKQLSDLFYRAIRSDK